MKLFKKMKDGGPESKVTGYFLVEIKSLFSIVLLKFTDGSRDAYHSHAFDAISWVLKGRLNEYLPIGWIENYHVSLIPILTTRHRFHRVVSLGTTWVLSFRGPWSDQWREYIPTTDQHLTLTHGRKIIKEELCSSPTT